MNTPLPPVGIPPSSIPPPQPEDAEGAIQQQTPASSSLDVQQVPPNLEEAEQTGQSEREKRSLTEIAAQTIASRSTQSSQLGSSTYSEASSSTSPRPTSPTSPLSSPTSISLIRQSRMDRISENASNFPRKQIPDVMRNVVFGLCHKLKARKQVEEKIKMRIELFGEQHLALHQACLENPTPENTEKLNRLRHLMRNAILVQRELKNQSKARRVLITTANLMQEQPLKTSQKREAKQQIHINQISQHEQLKKKLLEQRNLALDTSDLEKVVSLEKNIARIDAEIEKTRKKIKLPILATTTWLKKDIEQSSNEILKLEKELSHYELEILKILDPECKGFEGDLILVPLTRELDELNESIQFESDYLFELDKRRPTLSDEENQAFLGELAMQFLRIGIWPPRSQQPFNTFREAILQTMLTMALELYPPEFRGATSSGGVYRVFSNVEEMQGPGVMTLVKREIGCFKPEDEAPSGIYTRRPEQPSEPGLDPETASIRQALVSQLGTPTTTDSILAVASHPAFKYFPGEPVVEEEGSLRPMTRQEYDQRNLEALSTFPGGLPHPKFGVFMEWIHDGKNVYEGEYSPEKHDEWSRLIAQMGIGEIEETSYYHRVFDGAAYLNWDPNMGNMLAIASTEGIGQSLAWREIDMDKVFPRGFIGGTSRPLWGPPIPDLSIALNNEPLSDTFAELARDHYQNIESIIQTCKRFWKEAIKRKIALASSSSLPEDVRQSLIAKLQTLQWTEAHEDVLRATAVAIKVAADLKKTPRELFNLIDNTRVGPTRQFAAKSLEEIAAFYNVSLPQAIELIRDLHVYNFPHEEIPLYDVPSKLTHLFLLARARRMNLPVKRLQTAEARRKEEKQWVMKYMEEELHQPYWWIS